MLGYDVDKQLYLVQIVGTGSLSHNVVPDKAQNAKNAKKRAKVSASQYWVPRIRLLFAAENPAVFAERVAKAFAMRRETEALIRYNLYVDCMPMSGLAKLDPFSLERMVSCAKVPIKNAKRSVAFCRNLLSLFALYRFPFFCFLCPFFLYV